MTLNQQSTIMAIIFLAGLLGNASTACADNFKSPKECVPGKRVVNNMGDKGKILRHGSNETLCLVLLDTGKEQTSLFWMLRAEGASAETSDKLVTGIYQCYPGNPNQYTFMDLQITGATSYKWAGHTGTFHMGAANKIIFDSGPLKTATSKLLAGPSIGLNQDGGSFFGTHCDLKK